MKKTILIGSVAALALMLVLGTIYAQPMGPGMMAQPGGPASAPQQGGWYCPWGGGWGMGPGMMGPGWHRGYGMQRGWMSPGWQRGYGTAPGYAPQYRQPQKPLEKKEARAIIENYLKSRRNPNLKVGKIKDAGSAFEAEIVTRDDSLVDKILIDKNTGWIRSAY